MSRRFYVSPELARALPPLASPFHGIEERSKRHDFETIHPTS